jgi:hypothetical protein
VEDDCVGNIGPGMHPSGGITGGLEVAAPDEVSARLAYQRPARCDQRASPNGVRRRVEGMSRRSTRWGISASARAEPGQDPVEMTSPPGG